MRPMSSAATPTHHKETQKAHGGRWSKSHRAWVFDDAPACFDALLPSPKKSMQAASGPAAPHSHGHRERLRARFRESDGEGMPDYELLELLLFFSIRYVDVKPLAKSLLDEFGSLGAVLAAAPERLAAAIHGADPKHVDRLRTDCQFTITPHPGRRCSTI